MSWHEFEKENKEVYVGRFGGRKVKGEMQFYYNIKNKRKHLRKL